MAQLQNRRGNKTIIFWCFRDGLRVRAHGHPALTSTTALPGQRAPDRKGFCSDILFSSQNQARVMRDFASGVRTIVSSFLTDTKQQAQGGRRGHSRCCGSRRVSALPALGRASRSTEILLAAMGTATPRHRQDSPNGATKNRRQRSLSPKVAVPSGITAALSRTDGS